MGVDALGDADSLPLSWACPVAVLKQLAGQSIEDPRIDLRQVGEFVAVAEGPKEQIAKL